MPPLGSPTPAVGGSASMTTAVLRTAAGDFVDRLAMTDEQFGQLRDVVLAGLGDGVDRREHKRFQIPFAWKVRVAWVQGRVVSRQLARAFDMSASGMGLFNATFVHPGTPCTLFLPSGSGTWTEVCGVAARCAFVRGSVHQVGVRFDRPVDLATVLGKRDARAGLREAVDRLSEAVALDAPPERLRALLEQVSAQIDQRSTA